jgi:DNA-binding CsgD family transcriptional regulator
LTARQQEVLIYLIQGKSEKEIANQLGLSSQTVHDHMKAVYLRCQVHSRPELTARVLLPIAPNALWNRLRKLGWVTEIRRPGFENESGL